MAKMVGVKLAVPPKRGKFGSANIHELAYRAGDVPGDDYFEYISIESVGGKIQNFRIKNAVHITPQ